MSHFTVGVIIKGKPTASKIAELLAPFQENNCDDCPRQFLEFHNMEESERHRYETESIEKIKTPDGRLLYSWDDEFRVKGKFGFGTGTHEIPSDCTRVIVPFKEIYPTLEQFLQDWHSLEKPDDETGKYGYWHNPNSKWDWYQIGGRWAGFLRVPSDSVSGKANMKGEQSWLFKDEDSPYSSEDPKVTLVDFARIKDIIRDDQFHTYSVLKNGEWLEPGKMGWWACSHATEEEQQKFKDEYKALVFDNAGPNDWLTIVDCHI
jgi:hypothetical protein